MTFRTKLFTSASQKKYHLMIAEGVLDGGALQQVIAELAAEVMRHADYKVVIDLTESSCVIDPEEIDEQIIKLWPKDCKTALMCFSDREHSRLSTISARLARGGIRIAVFPDARAAIKWLDQPS
jgi:hypothetical protein